MNSSRGLGIAGVLVALLALLPTGRVQAQGIIQPGAGAVHRSMGGASTAAGADALGALYWNPAAISGLSQSEVVIGGDVIAPEIRLGSRIPAGAFGPLGPATTLQGLTTSDSGISMTSGLGLVYRDSESPLTFGVALTTLAGGSVNFPGDPGNPILAPVGPFQQFVLGPQAASLLVLGIMPTASYQVNDRLAVGFSPIIDVSIVSFDPAFFGPTNDANGDGLRSFPTGSHSRPFWGGGFRLGATYKVTDNLTAGVSYISPQWFETWRFNARNEVGVPFSYTTQFSLPQTISAGVSYTGIDRLMLNADVRHMDYSTTKLLGQPVVQGGANWRGVWVGALGARYQLSERLSVQAGYQYNENPIRSQLALFNTQLPALTQHVVSVGSYFQWNESLGLSLAYSHGFKNDVTGGVFPLVGTSTTIEAEYDAITFGIHVKFGPTKCREACEVCPCLTDCTPVPMTAPR